MLCSTNRILSYCFSSNEVSEIWITFPDPQIKYRRRKRLSFYFSKYVLKEKSLVHLKYSFFTVLLLVCLEGLNSKIIIVSRYL